MEAHSEGKCEPPTHTGADKKQARKWAVRRSMILSQLRGSVRPMRVLIQFHFI